LHLSYNSGVAFSLPIRGLFLQVLTIILIGGIIYCYIREEYDKKSKLLDAGYALILAGAISHAYERIFVGHVIDFIAVKYFAILNFADIVISIGAFCIIVYYFLYAEHRSR
jgi:signal peptidase II